MDYLLIVIAYLLGSISSAIIVARLAGLPDPRTRGSGNPGATNILRMGGKKLAAMVLLGDLFKGLLPVLAAHLLGMSLTVVCLTGLAAFLGHLYPVFFSFQGGKGVATFIGVLLGIHWLLGLCAIATWLLMASFIRISSLAALVMSALAPAYSWLLLSHAETSIIVTSMVIAIFWRHRSNIRNLLMGTEDRFTEQDEIAAPEPGSGSSH